MKCNPPCPKCQTPYSCGEDDRLHVEMYDPAMPTAFEFIDGLCDWVRFNFIRIVGFFAALGFGVGVYFTYFWS